MLLVALSLVMLLTSTVPVQAAPQAPAQRLDLVPEGCEVDEHKPGEFVVRYESEEVMEAASQENVAETYVWGPPSQRLVFDDIKAEKDPKERRIMEEAKKKELEERFGAAEGPYDEKGVDYVWGPDHSPGEFWVRYESKEAMEEAPREHVVEERGGEGPGYGADLFAQRLRFEEIENETNPEERRVMEEAEMQRLQGRAGVDRVGYAYPDVHLPGEFRVIYDSEEAMKAVPRKNVVWEEVDTSGPDGSFVGVQDLLFEEIKNERDPKKRRDLEEAKKKELEAWSGVRDVTYLPGDADPDCYWDTDVTPEGKLNFANARHELYGYICSPEGLNELFGGDGDAQVRLCGIYQSNPEACAITHRPGEFIVYYRSEEDMRAAPKANVAQEKVSNDPHYELFAQLLVFDKIKNDPDPYKQRAARIAKLQELEKRPGVRGVDYPFVARERHQECVDAEFGERVAEKPNGPSEPGGPGESDRPGESGRPGGPDGLGETSGPGGPREPGEPGLYDYVCSSSKGLEKVFGGDVDYRSWFCFPPGGGGGGGWCYPNCNSSIVDRARNLIGRGKSGHGGKANSGGRDAFEAALDGVRSAGARVVSASGDGPGTGAGGPGGGSSIPNRPKDAGSGTWKKVAETGRGIGEKTADTRSNTGKEAVGARDGHDERVVDDGGSGGGGVGSEGSGAKEEAANAGLQDADEGSGEAGEVSPDGDAADEREGHDGETGGYLTSFLSDAFYFVPNGNPEPANEGAGETDATGKETATSETATGEAATDEAGDGILSFLSDPFHGDRGGGIEGGDVGLGDAENAAASRDRETDVSTVVLGMGALLAAGVLVARGFFRR